MKLLNLTPHTLTLRGPLGLDHEIPPSGTVARVASTPGAGRDVAGVPVPVHAPSAWGAVVDLPGPEAGVLYIVSALVAGRVPVGRSDVVSPGTGPADGAVREAGRVVAVTRLVRARPEPSEDTTPPAPVALRLVTTTGAQGAHDEAAARREAANAQRSLHHDP